MTVYTHNSPLRPDVTNICMIVTDAPREALGLSADWYEVDAEEVADTEELTGVRYPEAFDHMQVRVSRGPNMERIEHWGRI